MSVRKIIVPAAGQGTRLYPITKSLPKEMLPLGRKPAIQLVAEEALTGGFSAVIVVTAMDKRAVEDHFDALCGNGKASEDTCHLFPDLLHDDGKFFYVRQSKPRGLGHAVLSAAEFIGGEPFGVALGDTVIWSPSSPGSLLSRMTDLFESHAAAGVVAVKEVERECISRFGIIAPGGVGAGRIEVTDIVEKPSPEEAPSNLAVVGRYLFAPVIMDYLRGLPPGRNGEVQLTDAMQAMVRDGHRMLAVPLAKGERWYDVGSFDAYAEAFVEIVLEDDAIGAGLRERVRVLLAATDAAAEPAAPLRLQMAAER